MLTKFNATIRLLKGDRRGASAIEYGLIVAGISIVIAALTPGIGTSLSTIFTNIGTRLATAANPT